MVCAAVVLEIHEFARTPAGFTGIDEKFLVSPGKSFSSIAKDLHTAGLVRSRIKFRILSRITGADRKIMAGEYLLSAALTPDRILEKLVSGDVILYRLTIPEGFSVAQIAAILEGSGWGSQKEFFSFALNPAFVENLNIGTADLEGYLFPDTYLFPKNTSPGKIIGAMTGRFKSVFSEQWEKRAKDLGFTVHQIVTLASIIEKETGDPKERPLISSVFHNRLRQGMRLETDPTVIYGIKDFNGNLTREHLKTPSPYNTYLNYGLPPGPISNPGCKSLEAALYPADSDFLYFVSRKDGTHHFSSNLNDHLRAVRKYQLTGKYPGSGS
jgi:UPF0755 protein